MLRQLLSATLLILTPFAALPAAAQWNDGPPREYDRRDERRFDRRDQRPDQGRGSEPVIIASERVNSRDERIVFRLKKGDGLVSELTVRTGNDAVLLNAIDITYANGRMQRVDIVDRLLPGEQSRPIVLDPKSPPITEVVVWKRPSWRPSEGVLQLIGVPRVPPRGAYADLRVIDRQTMKPRRNNVTFNLDANARPLDAIQFRIVDDPMLVDRVEIEFGNGERTNIDIRQRLMPGESTRIIEFDNPRRIQSVVLWKGSSLGRPGATTVEFLGSEVRRPPEPPQWSGVGPTIPRGWVLFGSQEVSFKVDRDILPVGREVGRFDRIALRVHDNDVFLREFTIVYGNGERDRRVVETALPAGSQTRPIDLDGKRFIREIELVYRSRPGGDTAIVEVYGEFARDWLGDRGGWRQHNSGWQMLGAQRASMFQKDSDAVNVGERFGRVKALRLTARRTDVRLYSVKVVYGNGEVEEIRPMATLKSGQTSPTFEIKGRGRFIDQIVLKYRSKLDLKGSGIIEIWGQT